MSGLQPPCVQHVLAFKVHSGEFIQIVHVRNNHWCVVSTVGCENGVVNVYDSLYPSVSMKTITFDSEHGLQLTVKASSQDDGC